MKFDKIITVEAINFQEARAKASRLYPGHYVFTYKSLAGRKQNLLEKGTVTKYKLFMLRKRR